MVRHSVLIAPFPRTMGEVFDDRDLNRLAKFADILWARDEPLDASYVDGVLPTLWSYVGFDPLLSASRLSQASNLSSIVELRGSFPSTIDYEGCFARGVRVLSCAPAFARQVAEMALALTLCSCRSVVAAHGDFVHGSEVWQGDRASDFTLFQQPVGFIGFGAIARNLLPLLDAFQCRVMVHDPWLPEALITQAGCVPTALGQLLRSSRVVYVLAAPAAENKGLIGAPQIALMEENSLLVLISRSHLVDFDALARAVSQGRIQAAIDVFPEEPLPQDHEIRGSKNVVLSPHRAASIRKERRVIGSMVVDDLELMARGLPPALMQVAQPEIVRRRVS